jgi:hypothetical protein
VVEADGAALIPHLPTSSGGFPTYSNYREERTITRRLIHRSLFLFFHSDLFQMSLRSGILQPKRCLQSGLGLAWLDYAGRCCSCEKRKKDEK